MQLIFEMNFGYVTCDIHGDGYNRIWVYREDDAWSADGSKWRAVLSSRCYGDEERNQLAIDELVEFMESKRFFVATRPARRNFNRFLEGLRLGKFDKASADERERVAQGLTVTPEVPRWEDDLLQPVDTYVCNDVCCNPPHEDGLL